MRVAAALVVCSSMQASRFQIPGVSRCRKKARDEGWKRIIGVARDSRREGFSPDPRIFHRTRRGRILVLTTDPRLTFIKILIVYQSTIKVNYPKSMHGVSHI